MEVSVPVILTERETKFVTAFALYGLKVSSAAKAAGYAQCMGKELLQKAHVRAAIRAVHRNSAAALERIAHYDRKAPSDAGGTDNDE